jgi:hypothetical protein
MADDLENQEERLLSIGLGNVLVYKKVVIIKRI